MLPTFKDISDRIASLFIASGENIETRPILLAHDNSGDISFSGEVSPAQRRWLETTEFKARTGKWAMLPGEDGVEAIVIGVSDRPSLQDIPLFAGNLSGYLPAGDYHLGWETDAPEMDALSWALGAYGFDRYKSNSKKRTIRLRLPAGIDQDALVSLAASNWLGRDLINIPANDLGPAELEEVARGLAEHFGAGFSAIIGDDLLEKNFPLIHTVGRASERKPRLLDMSWGPVNAPKVTIVGKGICFDTGGLNIKPGASMLLMKKDMGGAAASLALAAMIMSANLPVRLRVLIAAAENAISGNAFRPGDILQSRAGITVEVGDTDAEGRLVLADALALADEEKPDHLFSFATLTGSARVALGPDLPPVYSTDQSVANELSQNGHRLGDPMWPMPLWQPYDTLLESQAADVNSIFRSPFAGSIMAALFLKRFVKSAGIYTHFDIFGWVPRALPAKPVGGEPQCARAVFDYLKGLNGKV